MYRAGAPIAGGGLGSDVHMVRAVVGRDVAETAFLLAGDRRWARLGAMRFPR